MEQRANDLLLAGIQRQIKEASPTISECLRKGNDCEQVEAANDIIAQALRKGSGVELEIDVYGHLIIIEAKKQRISDKRF